MSNNKPRRDIADNLLQTIENYIKVAGWQLDENTLLAIDPVTGTKHVVSTAMLIQLERDLS